MFLNDNHMSNNIGKKTVPKSLLNSLVNIHQYSLKNSQLPVSHCAIPVAILLDNEIDLYPRIIVAQFETQCWEI